MRGIDAQQRRVMWRQIVDRREGIGGVAVVGRCVRDHRVGQNAAVPGCISSDCGSAEDSASDDGETSGDPSTAHRLYLRRRACAAHTTATPAAHSSAALKLRAVAASALVDLSAGVSVDFHAHGDFCDLRRFPHHGVLPTMVPTIALANVNGRSEPCQIGCIAQPWREMVTGHVRKQGLPHA